MTIWQRYRFTLLKKVLWIIAIYLLLIHSAYARDVLTSIGDSYKAASIQWQPRLLSIAKGLFWKLAAIEFAWATVIWTLKGSDMQSFTSAVVQKIIFIGFFYMLLQNADYWIPAIIQSLTKSGQIATGLKELTPSEVFNTGINTAVQMLDGIKAKSAWDDFATMVIGGISALIIVISFLIIAAQMLIALIESYIVIGGGILFLGFGGSHWTTDYTQKYISYAFATGVKIFMLYLVIGIGTHQADGWAKILSDVNLNNIFTVLGGSLLLAFLGFHIPNLASAALSGAPSLTANSVLDVAGAATVGVVGASAKSVSSTLQSARGGMQALKASYDYHRGAGSSALTSALKAPLTSAVDMTKEAKNTLVDKIGLSSQGSLQTNTIGGRAATSRRNETAARTNSSATEKQTESPSATKTTTAENNTTVNAKTGQSVTHQTTTGGSHASSVAPPSLSTKPVTNNPLHSAVRVSPPLISHSPPPAEDDTKTKKPDS